MIEDNAKRPEIGIVQVFFVLVSVTVNVLLVILKLTCRNILTAAQVDPVEADGVEEPDAVGSADDVFAGFSGFAGFVDDIIVEPL